MGMAGALAGCASGGDEGQILRSDAAASAELCPLPCEWVHFSKQGELIGGPPVLLHDATISDFIVVSHGWNTDRPSAAGFYQRLLGGIKSAWSSGAAALPSDRKYAVLQVLWPSKRFGAAADSPANRTRSSRDQRRASDVSDAILRGEIEEYAAFAETDVAPLMDKARAAIDGGLQDSDCAALLREVMGGLDEATVRDREVAADVAAYDPQRAGVLLRYLSFGRRLQFADSIARRHGLSDSNRQNWFRGIRSGICLLLNAPTYWRMKARAGEVGRGLAGVLAPLPGAARIHLIGHSFGARVVTSVAHHAQDGANLRSLTLLQGAFSHNALSPRGAFAGAHRKLAGPTAITHTHNDAAVTIYYPIASHLSGDTSRKHGGADDPYGAIGANGAQGIAEDAVALNCLSDPISFTPGKVHNIMSDACITETPELDAHMNVANTSVARIVATALVS